ncbi:MAG: PelD GGDEF domain-containing protein [Herminiimonas sp.]|uniref:PelD GGDEF domain-containing protein n=1 Tax=Herminiimonas sp. TaxID=1926289 RepID=UPI0027183E95|nr:PelD GGDEF domain-containing protein [Herminiimonas sp.]MDO9420302.1 PelD GGDEF domain-containing protein [Herminiimonas sp.]
MNSNPKALLRETAAEAPSKSGADTPTGRSRGIAKSEFYSRLLAPAVTGFSAVVESAIAMLIALAIGRIFVPEDPLFLNAGFPYAWILPIVIALRYGTLLGVFSALLILADWLAFYGGFLSSGAITHAFPQAFFLGGLLLIFIVGQFGDIWAGRMARAHSVNGYLSDRLSTLTKNHFLLKISHERLENDLLTKPTTLRTALLQMREVTLQQHDVEDLPGASQFLQFAAHACQLESAAMYALRDGRLMTASTAAVGVPFELDITDPLVTACLEKNTLAHLQTSSLRDGTSDYIACVPLLSGAEDVVGIVVVKHMPFLSLNQDNLQFLLILAGYYADGARPVAAVSSLLAEVPNCPQDFALEYIRLSRLERDAGVASIIVALTFSPGDLQETLFSHMRRMVRALDVSWRIKSGENLCLFVLMPLTDDDALSGYLLRAERSLQAQFGLDFSRAHIAFQSVLINSVDTGALKNLLDRIHADI